MNTDLEQYFKTNDIQKLHSWVSENYTMFYHIVDKARKRYNITDVSRDDLFSEAVIAFYRIVDKYNPTISKFSTFIYMALERELLNYMASHRAHDFERRVDVIHLDDMLPNDGSNREMANEEIVSTTGSDDIMTAILLEDLSKFVDTRADDITKQVYRLYTSGYNMAQIGTELGFTRQYISKVLQNLVLDVRKEWNIA